MPRTLTVTAETDHTSSRKKKNKKKNPFETPPPTAAPQHSSNKTRNKKAKMSGKKRGRQSASQAPMARRKIDTTTTVATNEPVVLSAGDDDDDDYARFVRSLNFLDDADLLSFKDDDDVDFQLDDFEEEDEDEEDEQTAPASPNAASISTETTSELPDIDDQGLFMTELEAELGSLLEEDLEAAVTTLLGASSSTNTAAGSSSSRVSPTLKTSSTSPKTSSSSSSTAEASSPSTPRTPLREASRASNVVTQTQYTQLQNLLKGHYQLLMQQGLLAIRAAAPSGPSEEQGLLQQNQDSHEDLVEILDGAVGMLQDLDQQRKDAIRTSIQLNPKTAPATKSKRSLLPQLTGASNGSSLSSRRPLTRAAFSKTLDRTSSAAKTVFDVKGLSKLKDTFASMDGNSGEQLLDPRNHDAACQKLLQQAGAEINQDLIPASRDVADLVSSPKEVFGEKFTKPTSKDQQVLLRKDRNQFTAAEDNLVLRGVNLYGEKQWLLIADRFLPDRSVNLISQRYSKLSIMLFRAHGIKIDAEGNLVTPPKFESTDKIDPVEMAKLKKVDPPAILNVHRWSIEEDLTLLKAVPIMGNMWAELSTRLIPHRDRGHLRKRYQVLERRVKATVSRAGKQTPTGRTVPKPRSSSASKTKNKPMKLALARKPTGKQLPPIKKRARPDTTKTDGKLVRGKPAGPLPSRKGAKAGRKGMALPGRAAPRAASLPKTSSAKLDVAPPPAPPVRPESNSTRTGFEQILEASNEWSQMSRVKKMMENDTESMVADAIVSNLAKGIPGNGAPAHVDRSGETVERLPQMEMDHNASSGFSMLDQANSEGQHSSPPKKRPRGSIMSSVIENAQKKGKLKGEEPPPPLTPSRPHAGPPTTPSVFTPSGRGPFPSPSLRASPLNPFPGFSPAGGFKQPGYSPGVNTMMFFNGTNGGPSDDFEYCNFTFSENSRQALELGGARGTPKGGAMPPPTMGQPLTPSNVMFHEGGLAHDGGLAANDFEAISALNSLSNSPARLLMKRPDSATGNDEEEAKKKEESSKKSLFAKVVGGVEEKKKSAKARH